MLCSLQSCPNFGFKITVICKLWKLLQYLSKDVLLHLLRSYLTLGNSSVWTTLQTLLQYFQITSLTPEISFLWLFFSPLFKDLKFWCSLAQRWKKQSSQHFYLFLIRISFDFI